MKILLDDYAKYHLILVIAGGCFALILLVLSIFFWVRFRGTTKISKRKWGFEKKMYCSFGLMSSVVTLLLVLLVAINATTAFNPEPGFALLANSTTTSSNSAVGRAITTWVSSGSSKVPLVITQKVHERIAWQRPKAIICGILLVISSALSTFAWITLVQMMRADESRWGFREISLLLAGIMVATFSLLMLVMTLANMQGAIAPMTITALGANG